MRRKKNKQDHVHFKIRCTCGGVAADCGCNGPMTDVLPSCIHRETPRQLFDSLVAKYVSFSEPDPRVFSCAIARIAEAWRKNPDDVFRELQNTVAEQNKAAAFVMFGMSV